MLGRETGLRRVLAVALLGALAAVGCRRSGSGGGSAAAFLVVINEVLPLDSGAVRVPVPSESVRAEEREGGAGSGHVWHPSGDWIELYNPNPRPVLLGGYYLTDNPKRPTKWRFPDGVRIGGTASGQGQSTADPYLIVWADGDPGKTVYDPSMGVWHLHANFSIDEEGGETILLVAPDGETIIDRFEVIRPDLDGDGIAEPDVSIIRDRSTGKVRPCWQPTPNVENSAPGGIGFGQLIQSRPVADAPVHVEVRVHGDDVDRVWLRFSSANDTSPRSAAMRDDGLGPDRVAGDRIYTAEIPAEYQIPFDPRPGQSLQAFLRSLESVRVLYAVEAMARDYRSVWFPRERFAMSGGRPNLDPPEAEGRMAYAVTGVDLVLNEFMTIPDGSVRDPLGRSADWIELFNAGSVAVPLLNEEGDAIFEISGRLESGRGSPLIGPPILPGEHRVFWIGVDRPAAPISGPGERDGYIPGIGLRGTGESILIRSGRLLMDALDYRPIPQYAGISVGRCPDGEPGVFFVHLAAPSPRAANVCGANFAPVFLDDATAPGVAWEEEGPGRIRITVRAADPDGEIPIRNGAVAARILWGEGVAPAAWRETGFVEADIVERRGRRLTLSRILEIAGDAVHRFYIAIEDDGGAVAYRSATGTTSVPPPAEDAFSFRTNIVPPRVSISEIHIAAAGDGLPSFLEIRNEGDEVVDLRGAYIVAGEREGDRIGWRIPDVDRARLGPGEFLVVCLGGGGPICDAVADLDAPATGGTFRLFAALSDGNLGLDRFSYGAADVPTEPGVSIVRVGGGLARRPSTPGAPNGSPPVFAWPPTRAPIDPEAVDAVVVRIGVKDPDAAGELVAIALHGFAYDEGGRLLREDVISTADPASAPFIAREGVDAGGFERIAFNTTTLSFASTRVIVRYVFRAVDRDGEVTHLAAGGPSAVSPDPASYLSFRKGGARPPISINEVPAPGAAWVELYNAGDAPIDVAGMRLVAVRAGDPDPGDTLGWEIPRGPETVIGARGFAAIAAVALGLDTSRAGTLRLYASLAEGNGTIDVLSWRALEPGEGSFGRRPDGAAATAVFGRASPGEPNPSGGSTFVRGDANGDGAVNVSDATRILHGLFGELGLPECLDAADVNDDGRVNVSDPSALLRYLFGDGDPPPPFPEPGADPTDDDLGCPAGP